MMRHAAIGKPSGQVREIYFSPPSRLDVLVVFPYIGTRAPYKMFLFI